MEKHQIVRPRRLKGTPYLKFSYKASGLVALFAVVAGIYYNYRYSDAALHIIKSGYFEDSDEFRKQRMRMSFLTLYSIRDYDKKVADFEEEDKWESMTSKPTTISEAEADV